MRFIVRLPFYALIGSVFLASGCVIAPEHGQNRDRGYQRHSYDAERRDHERREAYNHCREAGDHDCDDLLRHHD